MNNIQNTPRKLGSGFGPDNQFSVFLNEPNRGLINKLSTDKMSILHEWIHRSDQNKCITEVLDSRILAAILPDLLVDMSLVHLAKILPPLLLDLPDPIRNFFTQEGILDKVDRRFLNSLTKSLPLELSEGLTPAYLEQLLSRESLEQMKSYHEKNTSERTDRAFLCAYLIPVLLEVMENSQLEQAVGEIAKRLAPKNFQAAADANYFDLQLTSQRHPITVENNGRTLIFRAQTENSESPSLANYRGKFWKLDHTHIHLERDGEEREYVVYESQEQKNLVEQKALRDPNLDIVGEIHTVYKRLPKKYEKLDAEQRKNYWKYIAVAVPLRIGAFNQDFQDILDRLPQQNQLIENTPLDLTKNFQDIFLKKFNSQDVLYHSWGSLKSKTYAFRSGLSFNVIPSAIEVNSEQYNQLKKLFGSLVTLPEKDVLEPIDRKAGNRKFRII